MNMADELVETECFVFVANSYRIIDVNFKFVKFIYIIDKIKLLSREADRRCNLMLLAVQA